MSSFEQSSPPPPVSSLRSKFEQIAAAASPPPSLSLSPGGPGITSRKRSSSNADLRQQQLLDTKRIVSGPADALNVPVLRPSPSSPDLKGSGKSKPAPPPPRGSRTPSPQPPPPNPRPTHVHSFSNMSESSIGTPVQPAHKKSPSFSRRPPPPPPAKPGAVASPAGDKATPPTGGVASLRSKFNDVTLPAPDYFGNGHPTGSPVTRNNNTRSVSTSQPPALPARPGSDKTSPIKGPRASLPSLTTLTSDASPSRLSPAPRIHCVSPEASGTPFDDVAYALSRSPPPPPPPSRSNIDLIAKAANTVQQHDMQWTAEPEHSRTSSESTSSGSLVSENGAVPLKPRVPPRSRTLGPSTVVSPIAPPPLPPRRNASDELEELMPVAPPALPRRRSFDPTSVPPPLVASTKPVSRINGIAPPPTRAIGLNDKLPPARRQSDGDSEGESDGEPAADQPSAGTSRLNRTLEDLPDSTHCSRRLPALPDYKFAHARIPISAPSGVVAVAGQHVVVAGHHHLKVFDLTIGDAPVFTIDLKDLAVDWRVKDPRVTAMEFRGGGEGAERGKILWCGSKDGHVFEFDVVRSSVVRVRSAAHGYAVMHIMRHGRTMITLDESGKALVWKDHQDLASGGQPRIARVADKQGFVKMFGGLLWTSNGPGHGTGASGSTQRGPTIRVYDILSPNCTAKIITPPDMLGAVTSGTILPSQPHLVYLGHEGGYVTSWSLEFSALSPVAVSDTFDSGRAVPACAQVVKISVSDVLSLEGVVDRLWVGSRKGSISAYDVQTKPWTMTNSWQAHGELPVLKIILDPFSIEKNERMHVISVGRDEQMHFWDGLLGADWIEGEVQKREVEFSTFRNINVLICSWNIDAQKPDALTGTADNVNFLENVLHSVDAPDIIVFGFQELIDLEKKSLTAKTVLLGSQKKRADGSISEKVSRSYRMWHERLVHAVRLAMPVDDPYVVAHTDNLVGLFSCIFVRQRQRQLLRDSAMTTVKRGMGGRYGNKGAIVARFVIDDSSLCFINCHLAAGQSHTRARNQDVAAILEDGAALPRSDLSEALPYVGGGDGTMILDHEICFLGGDLNYRIDQRRDMIISSVNSRDLDFLLNHDQLRKQAKNNPGFRLRAFTEAPIAFAPTYKYDRKSDDYDSSEKKRAPAWCDRILYRCRDPSRVEALHYRRYEANISDHRPVSAAFRVTVKSIRHDARAVVKSQVQTLWQDRKLRLLFDARDFYLAQQIL